MAATPRSHVGRVVVLGPAGDLALVVLLVPGRELAQAHHDGLRKIAHTPVTFERPRSANSPIALGQCKRVPEIWGSRSERLRLVDRHAGSTGRAVAGGEDASYGAEPRQGFSRPDVEPRQTGSAGPGCVERLWSYAESIEPGRVFDRVAGLDDYRAMNDREAMKVMVRP